VHDKSNCRARKIDGFNLLLTANRNKCQFRLPYTGHTSCRSCSKIQFGDPIKYAIKSAFTIYTTLFKFAVKINWMHGNSRHVKRLTAIIMEVIAIEQKQIKKSMKWRAKLDPLAVTTG
jgi:hypothetical protein